MANGIKYSISAQTQALKKGNFWIATGDVGKSPSDGYYTELVPPLGGYTIYLNKASGGPSIFTASSDAQLIYWTKQISGNTYGTAAECLNWFAGQSDKMVVNESYPQIITDGLILNLDAGFTASYPRTGTSWYDLCGNGDGSILNAVTFNSSINAFILDGVDEYVSTSSNTTFSSANQNITLMGWCKQLTSPGAHQTVICTNVNYRNGIKLMSNYHGSIGVWVANSDGTNDYMLGSTGIQNTGWHFLAATRNTTGELKLYLDGVLVNSVTSFTGNTYINGTSSAVGRDYHSGANYYYNGYISSVLAYNRVLSISEIKQNYYQGPIVTSGLVFAVDAGNLVSYEPGSTSAYDLTGSVGAGTLSNGAYSIGNWFAFDGVDDEISFPHDPDYKNQSLSVDFWVNLDYESSGRHVMFTTWYGFTVEVNNPGGGSSTGGLSWGLNSLPGQYMTVAGAITYGSTIHIACTYNPTTNVQNIYTNGSLAGTQIVDGTINYGSDSLFFSGSWDRTKGKMGSMKIYNKDLSAAEVLQNYNAQKSRFGLL